MSKLLAIDPGSNALGLALFQDGKLLDAVTLTAPKGDRLTRIAWILDNLAAYMYFRRPTQIVVEDPLLRGAGNATMERLKGAIEATSQIILNWNFEQFDVTRDLYYLGPTYVKRHMGDGDSSKERMARTALRLAQDDMERSIIQEKIDTMDWDATDAICIGLTFLGRNSIGE